jgi:hypothetical protein
MAFQYKSYVLKVGAGTWTEFSGMDVVSARNMFGNSEDSHKLMLLDKSGDFQIYPNDTVSTSGVLISKKFALNGRAAKVMAVFTGTMTLTIRVYNIKFSGGYKDQVVSGLVSDTWKGLPGGLKGEFAEFHISGVTRLDMLHLKIV